MLNVSTLAGRCLEIISRSKEEETESGAKAVSVEGAEERRRKR